MKPVHVKGNTYINFEKEVHDNDPKSKVGDHLRIPKCKNIFAKEVSVISKIENTVPWAYVINDLNGEQIIGTFSKKELQKTTQKEFSIEKVIKRKGDELNVKWKEDDNSFNSWIDKKDLV